jgi:hypothetical protein
MRGTKLFVFVVVVVVPAAVVVVVLVPVLTEIVGLLGS